jgi:hypothetical protein
MLVFILPIALVGDAYAGLTIDAWILTGILSSLIASAIIYIVYIFIIRRKLVHKEILYCDEKEKDKNKYEVKLLVKTLTVAFSIAVVLFAGLLVLHSIGVYELAEKRVFTDDDGWEEFKEFMKNGKSFSSSESNFWVNSYNSPVNAEEDEELQAYLKQYLHCKNGDTYISYECRENFCSRILYLEFNDDGTPAEIAVVTYEAEFNAGRVYDAIGISLLMLIAVDFVICSFVYIVKISKQK